MNKDQALEILNTEVGVACLTNPHLVGMLSDDSKFSGYFDAADSDYEKHVEYITALGIKNLTVPKETAEVLAALKSAAEQCIPEATDVIRRYIVDLDANQ